MQNNTAGSTDPVIIGFSWVICELFAPPSIQSPVFSLPHLFPISLYLYVLLFTSHLSIYVCWMQLVIIPGICLHFPASPRFPCSLFLPDLYCTCFWTFPFGSSFSLWLRLHVWSLSGLKTVFWTLFGLWVPCLVFNFLWQVKKNSHSFSKAFRCNKY